MHYHYKLLLFVFLIFTGTIASAQPVIEFDSSHESTYIGKSVATFQDSSNRLTLDDVKKVPHLFKQGKKSVPDFGVTGYNNWVRLRVVNKTDRKHIILTLSYPPIDEVAFYEIRKGTQQRDTQYALQPSHRHEFSIFNIDAPRGDTITCYLKLRSNKQLIVPITLGNTQDMLQELTMTDAFSGMYLGIMIVMILYNLFVYFSAKDRQYLYYVNYILWVTLAQATLLGYIQRFVLMERDSWMAQHMLTFFGTMSGIGTVIFVKYFLSTKTHTPRWNVVLNVIMVADIIAILLLVIGYPLVSYMVVNLIAALGAISIFITAILVYRKNKKPAFFFLIAWSIFLFSVLLFVLKDFDVFPYNFFTVHSVQVGSALEAILLSFALADRINILKKEKDQSRLAALRIAKENSRIIKEQNIVLEQKVKERTEELVDTNKKIQQTLADLQQAQMQLVEAEKMASLGQLTAGIAHEINNPINFVTGNIGPLKRDVDILLQTIGLLEKLNTQNISDEEKIKQTNLFKEEQDFDYLKMEINHLLKGINEGASRTAEIVKSLRIFSRLDEAELKLADINEGIESTIIIVNNLLGNIAVTRKYGNLPLVHCYPGKLNQVFLNIISNALFAITEKFGEAPGGQLTVSTSCDEEQVYITIEDNGTGMTEETKRKVFDPFFTTKDVGQGTGLGMSIAFTTIQKHSGHIGVQTEIGVGTTFTLQIPVNAIEIPA